MMMTAKKQGLMKDGTRPKTPSTKGGRGGGMPRIMWLAVVACIAGAVFLFRSQSSEIPTGIGENQTVVTASDTETRSRSAAEGPRSGDVDIADEAKTLTPEPSDSPTTTVATKPAETKAPATKVAEAKPAPKQTEVSTPAPESIKPADNGPYVVQIGSFGKADNADKEAARLQQAGWNAMVKLGNTSGGAIIFRVRIGYFKARSDAEAFIKQNRKQMSGAIAVHR